VPLHHLKLGDEARHTLSLRAGPRVSNVDPNADEDLGHVEVSVKCMDGRQYRVNLVKVHLLRGRNFHAMDWGGGIGPLRSDESRPVPRRVDDLLRDPGARVGRDPAVPVSDAPVGPPLSIYGNTCLITSILLPPFARYQMSQSVLLRVVDQDREAVFDDHDFIGQIKMSLNDVEMDVPVRGWFPMVDWEMRVPGYGSRSIGACTS